MSKVNGVEYQMSKKMFDALLKSRHEDEKNVNPYEYVMKIINEGFGVKGTVTHISIYG